MTGNVRNDPLCLEQLLRGCEALGLPPDEAKARQLLNYLAMLRHWNRHFNLTRIQDPAEMVAGHLLDALTVVPFVKPARLLDVGSGGGVPGVPLAIFRPDWQVCLLDSNGKKTRFLNQVKIELRLSNVHVVHGRAESYQDVAGFDTVVCRALASVQEFVANASHLCRPGGIMIAMKGQYPAQELDVIRANGLVCSVEHVAVPGINVQRHLVIISDPGRQ